MKGRMLALGALGLGISFLATAAPAAAQVGTAAPRMLSTVNAANPAVQRAARAQQVARSRAGRIEVARGARRGKAPGHARRRPSQQYVVIKVAPTFNGAIAIANAMAFNTAMQGWKPLTTGATGGGPELVRINDQLFLVVAAPDGAVHSARIDEGTLDIVPTSWTKLTEPGAVPARGDVACEVDWEDFQWAKCATLTTGGAAATVIVANQGGFLAHAAGQATLKNLGGQNAGARPAPILRAVQSGFDAANPSWDTGSAFKMPIVVWDGAQGTFTEDGTDSPFRKVDFITRSAMACDTMCLFLDSANRFVGVGYEEALANLTPEEMIAYSFMGATPSGGGTLGFSKYDLAVQGLPGGKPQFDYVILPGDQKIVQVGADGALQDRSTNASGAWNRLGGWVKPGAFPACTVVNGALTCAIQALDGKVYIKRWGNSAGL